MKIAILLGVDKYDSVNNLPACKTDLSLIEKIIRSSEQYSEIITICDNCSAVTVKSRITEFLSELRGKEIDEAFFYFTGHGDFYDDQFHFILSDFNPFKRKQTSLENSEVDNWLRSLNPNVAVKIIDACNSGVIYIKNDNAVNEYLEKSKAGFKNCYFMFSSRSDQSSYQDSKLSFFTRSFVFSLCKELGQKIRYKDIIDSVSDNFEQIGSQTPIFVTQGTYTEVFCYVNSEMLRLLENICVKSEPSNDRKENVPELGLKKLEDIIKFDSSRYCSKEEAEETLAELKEHAQQFSYSSKIKELFEIKYDFKTHDEDEKLPKEPVIGYWLSKNGQYFFAEPTKEEESYEKDVVDYSSALSVMRGGYRTVTRYRNVISGFKSTANLCYNLLSIVTNPKYPNIPAFNCTVVFILSKDHLNYFYFYTQYEEKNWVDRELIPDIKWERSDHELKDKNSIFDKIDQIQKDFSGFVINHLENRFGHLRS